MDQGVLECLFDYVVQPKEGLKACQDEEEGIHNTC